MPRQVNFLTSGQMQTANDTVGYGYESAQSDQGLHCPQTESSKNTNHIEQQRPFFFRLCGFVNRSGSFYFSQMSSAMQKCAIGNYVDSEGPDQTAHPRSLVWAFAIRLQSLHTVEYIDVKQRSFVGSVVSLAELDIHYSHSAERGKRDLMPYANSEGPD